MAPTTSRLWHRRPTYQEDHHRRPTHQDHHRRPTHQDHHQRSTHQDHHRRPTHQEDHHRRPTHQEYHHRHTSHQERYLQVPTINQKRITPSHQPRYTPINEGFTTIVKLLFRYVQLSHHFNNWESLPNNINRDLEKLFGSIKPPCPSHKIDLNLKTLKEKTKADMVVILTQHIQDSLSDTVHALGAIPYNKDCDQAAHIAQQQLKRFGKRMTRDFIHMALLQGLDTLGHSREFDNNSPTGFDRNYEETITQEQETEMESDLQEIVMVSDLPINPPSAGEETAPAPITTTTQTTDKSDKTLLKRSNINKTIIISIPPLQRDRNGNPLFKQKAPTSNTIQITEPLMKQGSRISIESKASSTSLDSTSKRLSQPTTQRKLWKPTTQRNMSQPTTQRKASSTSVNSTSRKPPQPTTQRNVTNDKKREEEEAATDRFLDHLDYLDN